MGESRFYPSVADEALSESTFTSYDEQHLLIYADLLETEADGGDWDEAALLVLRIDPVREPLRARRVWEDHLTRAKWLVEHGYGHLFCARAATGISDAAPEKGHSDLLTCDLTGRVTAGSCPPAILYSPGSPSLVIRPIGGGERASMFCRQSS